MRVTARVEVNLRTREVKARGAGFAQEFANAIAEKVAEFARRNVAPGRGPGPHPHRPQSPHIDTGELMRSIQVKEQPMGFLKTAIIWTDVPYGAHLEYGWTTRSGTHWRYPWCLPAVEEARAYAAVIARSTARRWLSDEGFVQAGRVNLVAPTTATFFPEFD